MNANGHNQSIKHKCNTIKTEQNKKQDIKMQLFTLSPSRIRRRMRSLCCRVPCIALYDRFDVQQRPAEWVCSMPQQCSMPGPNPIKNKQQQQN